AAHRVMDVEFLHVNHPRIRTAAHLLPITCMRNLPYRCCARVVTVATRRRRTTARGERGLKKRLARIAMLGACSVAVLLPASAAYAGGSVDRTHTSGEAVSIPFTNPCTGEVDQLDLVASGQHLLVVRGNGTFKTLDNTHGTFTLSDGSTGRFVTSSNVVGGT